MPLLFLKRLFLCLLWIGGFSIVSGQNLVPNYSFEDISSCPESYGGSGPSLAPPWLAPTAGTADIFNECCTSGLVDVPSNTFGVQAALTGVGYAGGYTRLVGFEYREYMTAPLLEPLQANTWYFVSFYVSLAEFGCAVSQIGAYFSAVSPSGGFQAIDAVPQVESNQGFLNDYENWTLISGCFEAVGGEAFITIGNFHTDPDTPQDPVCQGANSYYYYEDVSVVEATGIEEIPIDLGGPVFECFSYEIDPGIPDVNYLWEDGSQGPTLVVTESGTYSVTISENCNFGIDSIEVIIGGVFDPIDLGPDVVICNGDEYIITLDPDLSEYEWNDGSNESEYTITSTGTFTVTLDDGCLSSSDEISVEVLDPPAPFSLGDDMFLCSGDEFVISFDPSLGDFLWQDGNTLSTYTIDQGGTYALTITNMCGAESDEISITDLEVPEVEIGPDELTICDGELIDIEVDQSLGDILWNDGSSEPNYEIYDAGIYTVYVTNLCGTGSDQVEVIVVDNPVVDLGPDSVLCSSESIILTTMPVNGNYSWQDNSSGQSFLVNGPGKYHLTISNFCGTVSDTVRIDYLNLPMSPGFGPDVSLCPGEEIILYANNPNADYLWQDLSVADSLLVTNSGTYSVQVSNECGMVADTISVIVNADPPQVDLPAQLSLCQGQSITLDAVVGGVSYLWNDNSQNQQLQVSTPGTYSLTVSNACGSDADTTLITDGGPAPAVVLGNDLSLCAGETITLSPVFSNVDSWLWQDGSTLPSYIISVAGAVTVEVNNSCGNAFDTLQVALLPDVPLLDLGPDNTLCTGESFVLSIITPNVTIQWPDGSSANDFLVDYTGLVVAAISNSCGVSYDTIEVLALPDIPALNLGPDQSLCPGEVITLDPGIIDVIYEWQDGTSSNTYISTQQETVILTISNDCGAATDTLQVIESTQGPQVNLGNDVQVCEGETVTILSGISGVNYLWQDGSTNPNYSTTQSGIFTLTVNNSCGTDADTIAVDISGVPPTPALGPDTTVCENISLLLTSTADAITTIQWQDGSSSPSFNVTSPGTYILAESNRCGDAADTIIVSYQDAPEPFTLGRDTTLCPGETITLNVPFTSFEIMWQDGSNQSSIIADQPITYSLQLSNDCGIVSDDFTLSFDTRVPVLDLGPDLFWCEGDLFTLDASQSFIADYFWSTGSFSSSIEIASPGIFSVEVSTPCAVANAQVTVEPSTDCYVPEIFNELYIPNVFSPNNDGINDMFTLSFGQDLDITRMQGSIYDRWGNLVFSSADIPFSWNGLFNDELMLPGVYVYTISIDYSDQGALKAIIVHGDVTLMR